MAYDVEQMRFCGMVASVAEDDLSVSISGDEDQTFRQSLYQRYIEGGKPRNPRNWIRQELKKHFLFVTKPPVWIGRMTHLRWPFFQGKPMVFIDQVEIPESDVSRAALFPEVVLYVFGAKKPVDDAPGASEMLYQVVAQPPGL